MKISAQEFWEWHETAWPEGMVWVDGSTLDDGREIYAEDGKSCALPLAEIFTVPDWWSVYNEDDPSVAEVSIRSLIRKWRRDRDSSSAVVTVPKADMDALRAIASERGWKLHAA